MMMNNTIRARALSVISVAIWFASISTTVYGQEVEVNRIQYQDMTGATVPSMAMNLETRALVLFMETNRPLTQQLLGKLRAAKVDWRDSLSIVMSGTAKEVKATMSAFPLVGVKWYATPQSRLSNVFNVAGTPFVMGLQPKGATAWKVIGEPAITEKDFSKLRGWIEPAPINSSAAAKRTLAAGK
jgi:hypothetical protein